MIEGLNELQARGVLNYELTRNQVENESYNQDILNTMMVLHNTIPVLRGQSLYETAMNMQSYQIRGILEHQLTLAQVGIGFDGNNFKQQKPENLNFSENTVNALEFLKSQNQGITDQKAYDIAIELSSLQVRGLTDFGLSLEQVSMQEFKNPKKNILAKLLDKISEKIKAEGNDEDFDFSFPLSKEQKEIAKSEFDKILRKKVENKEVQEIIAKTPDLSDLSLLAPEQKIKPKAVRSNSGSKPNRTTNTLKKKSKPSTRLSN
jgi:hypothetical protein